MQKHLRSMLPPLLLLYALGCSPDFDKFWQVEDLRVLAIKSTPPEVLFISPPQSTFPAVKITALVSDPRAPAESVQWELWACTPEQMTCDEATMKLRFARGVTRQDKIEADFVLTRALYDAALELDTFKGFGGLPVKVELRVSRGEYSTSAIKRVVYGYILPPGKWPNNNPEITELLVDGKPLPASWEVEAGVKVTLLPKSPSWDKEDYLVVTFSADTQKCLSGQSFEGCSKKLTEYLSYAYFATSGKIWFPRTGGKPRPFITDKKVEDISSDWTPEPGVGTATLWIVVRDDRGGVGWLKPLTVTVKDP